MRVLCNLALLFVIHYQLCHHTHQLVNTFPYLEERYEESSVTVANTSLEKLFASSYADTVLI